MSILEKAEAKEEEGDYREAAALYTRSAFDRLIDCNFEPKREMRIGLAVLLMAISCDVRTDNHRRARHLFDIAKPLFHEIGQDAETQVLVGLTKEWLGDGLLMLGSPDAIEFYQEAAEYYDDLEWGERSWGHEQEFHYASIAIESFLTANSVQVPKDPHLPLHFTERIEFKIETAKRLLEKQR
jgi:hypothetical protein